MAHKNMPTQEQRRAIEDVAQAIAGQIGAAVDEMRLEVGFALLVFTFGEEGFSTYVSNARREDMIKALRENADRLEADDGIVPPQREQQ